LSFLYLNAPSIASKLEELNCTANDLKPDLIFITESWCNENVTNAFLTIPGYEVATDLRLDRQDTTGGQCCQVLRRLFRQLNQNLLLFGENTPLFHIFLNSATFPLFFVFSLLLNATIFLEFQQF
jgi:hypothetical protein